MEIGEEVVEASSGFVVVCFRQVQLTGEDDVDCL
jgi:hypothetical protein